MYRRSVLRSDHLLPHILRVLENNVLWCLEGVTVVGRHCADAMLTKWFSSTRLLVSMSLFSDKPSWLKGVSLKYYFIFPFINMYGERSRKE
jgi:hypothetical protein